MFVYRPDNYSNGSNMNIEYGRFPNDPHERIQQSNRDIGYSSIPYTSYNLRHPNYWTDHESMPNVHNRCLHPVSYIPNYGRSPNMPNVYLQSPHQRAGHGVAIPYSNYLQPYPIYPWNPWSPMQSANHAYLANSVPNFQMQRNSMPSTLQSHYTGRPHDGFSFFAEQHYVQPHMYYPMGNPFNRDFNNMYYPIESSPPISEVNSDSLSDSSSYESTTITPEPLDFPCNNAARSPDLHYYYIPWNSEFSYCRPPYVLTEPILTTFGGTHDSNDSVPKQYYPQLAVNESLHQQNMDATTDKPKSNGIVARDKFVEGDKSRKVANNDVTYSDKDLPSEIKLEESEIYDEELKNDTQSPVYGNLKEDEDVLSKTRINEKMYGSSEVNSQREQVYEKAYREQQHEGVGNWCKWKRMLESTSRSCDMHISRQTEPENTSMGQTSENNDVSGEILQEIEDDETCSDSSGNSENDITYEEPFKCNFMRKDGEEGNEDHSESERNIICCSEVDEDGVVTHSVICRHEMNGNSGNSEDKRVCYDVIVNGPVSLEVIPTGKDSCSGVQESSRNSETRDDLENPFSVFPKVDNFTPAFPDVRKEDSVTQIIEALETNRHNDASEDDTDVDDEDQDLYKPSHCNPRYLYQKRNHYHLSGNWSDRSRSAFGSKSYSGKRVPYMSSHERNASTSRDQDMNFDSEKRERRPTGPIDLNHQIRYKYAFVKNSDATIVKNEPDLSKKIAREDKREQTEKHVSSENTNSSSQIQFDWRNEKQNIRTVKTGELISDIKCTPTSNKIKKCVMNARPLLDDRHDSKSPTASSYACTKEKVEDSACSVKLGQNVKLRNPSNRSWQPQVNQNPLRNFDNKRRDSNEKQGLKSRQNEIPDYERFHSDGQFGKLSYVSEANEGSQQKNDNTTKEAKNSSESVKDHENIIDSSFKNDVRKDKQYGHKFLKKGIQPTVREIQDAVNSTKGILWSNDIDCSIPEFLVGNLKMIDALLKTLQKVGKEIGALSTTDENLIEQLEMKALDFAAMTGKFSDEESVKLMKLRIALRNIRMKIKKENDSRALLNYKVVRVPRAETDNNTDLTKPRPATCRNTSQELSLTQSIIIKEFLGGNLNMIFALIKKLEKIENNANVLSVIDEDLIEKLESKTAFFMATTGKFSYTEREKLMQLKTILSNIRMKVKEEKGSITSLNSNVIRGVSAAAGKTPDFMIPHAAARASASLDNSIRENIMTADLDVLRKSSNRNIPLIVDGDLDVELANTIFKSNADKVLKLFLQGDRDMIDLVLSMFQKVQSKQGVLITQDKVSMRMLDAKIGAFLRTTDDDVERAILLELRYIVRFQDSAQKIMERLGKYKGGGCA